MATEARGWVRDDRVLVDWGDWVRLMDIDHETAFRFAEMFITLGRQAERCSKGAGGMTKKELDRMEEGIVSPRHRLVGSSSDG